MAESMVADHVPGLSQLAHDIRPLLHVAPDKKKRCLHIMLGKGFEQAKRMRVIRTIVVSQRQLPASRFESGKRLPIPLPPRSHRLVAESNRRYRNTSPEH